MEDQGRDVPGGDFSGAAGLVLVLLAVRAGGHGGFGGDILRDWGGYEGRGGQCAGGLDGGKA
jgi:hypothetical protein